MKMNVMGNDFMVKKYKFWGQRRKIWSHKGVKLRNVPMKKRTPMKKVLIKKSY